MSAPITCHYCPVRFVAEPFRDRHEEVVHPGLLALRVPVPAAPHQTLLATVEHAVARNTDPDTSWEAAQSVGDVRRSQQEVFDLIRRAGGTTDEELLMLAKVQGIRQSPSGLRTRRAELVDKGLVRDSGRRTRGRTGRRMIVWEAVGE